MAAQECWQVAPVPMFQWEAILHCPTAEGHRAVPSSVSRNGDCLHVWLTGRADLIRLFQKTLFGQTDPVTGDAVRFLYTKRQRKTTVAELGSIVQVLNFSPYKDSMGGSVV